MFAKIGPGRNSNSRVFWLKIESPVTSVGWRSGVHWMRANARAARSSARSRARGSSSPCRARPRAARARRSRAPRGRARSPRACRGRPARCSCSAASRPPAPRRGCPTPARCGELQPRRLTVAQWRGSFRYASRARRAGAELRRPRVGGRPCRRAPPGSARRRRGWFSQKLSVLPRIDAGSVIEKLPFASGQRSDTGLTRCRRPRRRRRAPRRPRRRTSRASRACTPCPP